MCVIVHQPSESYLSRRTAELMWDKNPDGAGFAFINDDGRIETGKAMNFDSFWKQFETKRSKNRDKDFLVHFRIATSGKIGLDNTHPFVVDEFTVMAHNGMLNSIVGSISKDAELSDTRQFIEQVVKELPETWLDNPTLVKMMEDYIGASKLMFLTTNPALKKNVYILNEHMGSNVHRMWWSNDYHLPRPKVQIYPPRLPNVANAAVRKPAGKTVKAGIGPRATEMKKEEQKNRNVVDINQYKVPLPSPRDNYPTQADVEAFWLATDVQGVLRYETLPEDTDQAFKAMMALRAEMGLTEDVLFNPHAQEYECQVCYETVDETTGDCNCWDLICVGCGSLAPYCIHHPEDADFYPVKEAWEVYKDRTGDRKEKLDLPTTL